MRYLNNHLFFAVQNHRKTCRGNQLTYDHQQTPQTQNEVLNVDHHKLGNQQPSNNNMN